MRRRRNIDRIWRKSGGLIMVKTILVAVLGAGPLFNQQSSPTKELCPFCLLYPEFECPLCKEE